MLTVENSLLISNRQLRRLVVLSLVVYKVSLILTLIAVLWNTPGPWGLREVALIFLVALQVTLYSIFFGRKHYPQWSFTQPWLTSYFLINLAVWLVEWHLETGFWWVIWVQMLQLYFSLPLKVAIPVTSLVFLVVAHFESGLDQFFGFPMGEVIERLIPWVIVTISFSFISVLVKANQERARLIAELQAARQELEVAHQQEVELAALRERERLARDMHDSLGHALVALSVQLEAVQRLYPVSPAEASRQVDEMKALTRSSMEALRRTLAGLRAPGLNQRTLTHALADLSEETRQRAGLKITCRIDPAVDQLSPAMTEALWRVTQEALMNVEKHAAARQVRVELQMKPESVILRVSDDGVGLPPNPTNRPGHYGLQGMRERLEGLGGVLTMGGNGRSGTVIEACLPLIGSKTYAKEEKRVDG